MFDRNGVVDDFGDSSVVVLSVSVVEDSVFSDEEVTCVTDGHSGYDFEGCGSGFVGAVAVDEVHTACGCECGMCCGVLYFDSEVACSLVDDESTCLEDGFDILVFFVEVLKSDIVFEEGIEVTIEVCESVNHLYVVGFLFELFILIDEL